MDEDEWSRALVESRRPGRTRPHGWASLAVGSVLLVMAGLAYLADTYRFVPFPTVLAVSVLGLAFLVVGWRRLH